MKRFFQVLTVFIAIAALVQTIAIAGGKNESKGKKGGIILKGHGGEPGP